MKLQKFVTEFLKTFLVAYVGGCGLQFLLMFIITLPTEGFHDLGGILAWSFLMPLYPLDGGLFYAIGGCLAVVLWQNRRKKTTLPQELPKIPAASLYYCTLCQT
jgi:hypothetical protein